MSDKDKRSAFTSVVMSDLENNTQEVVYNSYTLPLLIRDGTDMSKNIEKIEAVPDKGITIQNDIIFYDNTYEDANSTFEFVMITMKELEGSQTHSLAELIEHGFTITPFISANGGGGSSDFSTAKVTVTIGTLGHILRAPCIFAEEGEEGSTYDIQESGVYKVILYKGNASAYSNNITATSGAIKDLGNGLYLITGDCAITIA